MFRSEPGLRGTSSSYVVSTRVARARETLAALRVLEENPSRENIAAFHELHAQHLREDGEFELAVRADARARAVRQRSAELWILRHKLRR
jgi:hypothetical protein